MVLIVFSKISQSAGSRSIENVLRTVDISIKSNCPLGKYNKELNVAIVSYELRSADPAPVGVGDAGSWFRYYKLDVTGPTMVPKRAPYLTVKAGDTLEFKIDDKVIGWVEVTEVMDPATSYGFQEIWYNADLIRRASTLPTDKTEHPFSMKQLLFRLVVSFFEKLLDSFS